jgi:4-hydroxybenzoate polyprenyltransferase
VTSTRPRWRAYLLLSRVSNLPTVWTNVLAGMVAAPVAISPPRLVWLAIAMSLMYTGGMFLNDAFDAEFDAAHRPDRPVPAGDVTARAAYVVGFGMLAAGVAIAAVQSIGSVAVVWALTLAAAVIYYNFNHKLNAFGPLVMGLCRGLVYCTAAAAATGVVRGSVLIAAAALMLYVVALTWIAKRIGTRASVVIPILIAGISVFDAIVVLIFGGGAVLATSAVTCAFLTLALQRVVPGT